MHQPLHNLSLYSTKYKKGDEGGNFIKVDMQVDQSKLKQALPQGYNYDDVTELHALWDSVLGYMAGWDIDENKLNEWAERVQHM